MMKIGLGSLWLVATAVVVAFALYEPVGAQSGNPTPVACQANGTEQWAQLENARPGITEYEQCYSANTSVPGGPLTGDYCIRGKAWWTEGTDTVWVFCNDDTLYVNFYR